MREPNTCALPLSLPSHHDRSITHGRGDGHPRPLKWEGTGRERRSHKFLLPLSPLFGESHTADWALSPTLRTSPGGAHSICALSMCPPLPANLHLPVSPPAPVNLSTAHDGSTLTACHSLCTIPDALSLHWLVPCPLLEEANKKPGNAQTRMSEGKFKAYRRATTDDC